MDFTANEMMTIAAARALSSKDVCFVGIGAPSAACNVARLTHAPDITLIYESGTIGTAPDVLQNEFARIRGFIRQKVDEQRTHADYLREVCRISAA